MIYDHAPWPGPMAWDFRCLVCSEDVDQHAGLIARWRWRRRRVNQPEEAPMMITTLAVEVRMYHPEQSPVGYLDPRVLTAAEQMLVDRPGVSSVTPLPRPSGGMFDAPRFPAFSITLATRPEDQITTQVADLTVSESFRLVWSEDGGEKTTLIALEFIVLGDYL